MNFVLYPIWWKGQRDDDDDDGGDSACWLWCFSMMLMIQHEPWQKTHNLRLCHKQQVESLCRGRTLKFSFFHSSGQNMLLLCFFCFFFKRIKPGFANCFPFFLLNPHALIHVPCAVLGFQPTLLFHMANWYKLPIQSMVFANLPQFTS